MTPAPGQPTRLAGPNSFEHLNEQLDWAPVLIGETWVPKVDALLLSGTIRLSPWPSEPSNPNARDNTPNPVDGGNITNDPDDIGYWPDVIAWLESYDGPPATRGRGRWHDTAASVAHEEAHWNDDYREHAVNGSDWPSARAEIERQSLPRQDDAESPEHARQRLDPFVLLPFLRFRNRVTDYWTSRVVAADHAGGGGRGYGAGMRVLHGHIARIRAYAASKGWTEAQAGPAAAPEPPRSGHTTEPTSRR